jgi:hypothetical protein
LILSLIGVVVDKNKRPAILGLILCGIIAAVFSLLVLC